MNWRERAHLQGWRLWALVAVLAYTLIGFLFLPWLARNQAPKLAQENLGVDLAIEKIRFNPYLFKLTVEGLSLEDPESGPVLAVKLQAVFGWSETPRVTDGQVPIVLHLLDPAGRPLAVTSDLASFWENAYPEVARQMRGRYPKHPWPDNPLSARPTMRTKPKRSG